MKVYSKFYVIELNDNPKTPLYEGASTDVNNISQAIHFPSKRAAKTYLFDAYGKDTVCNIVEIKQRNIPIG